MTTTTKKNGPPPAAETWTAEQVRRHGLELGDGMRALAKQCVEQAEDTAQFAERASGKVIEVVNTVASRCESVMEFCARVRDSCQSTIAEAETMVRTEQPPAPPQITSALELREVQSRLPRNFVTKEEPK